MRKTLTSILFLSVSLFGLEASAQANRNNLNFKSVDEMYDYFKYGKDKRIISGHRGTVENGFPENSIEGMAEVLKFTPAIFEVDPRFSKDSVAVMVHDDMLDRTTNGKGKVSDFTLAELKQLRLKDVHGNVTDYQIPTLDEMIVWAKGKTILNLDKKDLPLQMTADIIKKHNAYNWVWVTVHNVDQAKFYLKQNPKQYLSMHIRSKKALEDFVQSGLPYNRMIVYIGSKILDENQDYLNFFKDHGVMCMMSSAPSYDKLPTVTERAEMYRAVFGSGATILESDLPIEVSKALK